MSHQKNSFCSYCGTGYPAGLPWPRACTGCGTISYVNPIPVAVAVVPVGEGVLVIRRTIPPGIGKLALPGGFMEVGETWQEGVARELREETGLVTDPGEVRLFRAHSAPAQGLLLLFGLTRRFLPSEVPDFAPNSEASEMVVVPAPVELAFPLHTAVLLDWFQGAR
ncbi:MAG: NUDIX domain-containing protein [Gemmataceae bacterium]|nr:NUDIX domain-containing protein [Gemmataceae bacterium]